MARNALGKGLNALIRPPEPPVPEPAPIPVSSGGTGTNEVDLDQIDPNPHQPRTQFREEALRELAESIRSAGIVQPLVLRKSGDRFQLIAGERRWRAAQIAGLNHAPAIIRDIPDSQALEITLVENIQREDLSAIEQAKAFERLISEFGLTQEEVGKRTGKDRVTVSNTLRLLNLEKSLQEMIDAGRLTAGHGRALLSIEDPRLRRVVAERAARGRLNVRQIERLAARRKAREVVPPTRVDPNVRAALEELQRELGTRVLLRPRRGSRPGQLAIEYYDDRQLVSLYDRLLRR